MVTVPSISIRLPHGKSNLKILTVIATIPKIPDLVKTPDNRLEAGAGATGCALGSQI